MPYVLYIIQTQNALICVNHFPVAHSGFGNRGATIGGLGAAASQFVRFSCKKTLILAHFLIEKGRAVSAVTMENAKVFLQLMSKSRSLAKICERRLQPLLV